jgi:hypothetical protein
MWSAHRLIVVAAVKNRSEWMSGAAAVQARVMPRVHYLSGSGPESVPGRPSAGGLLLDGHVRRHGS